MVKMSEATHSAPGELDQTETPPLHTLGLQKPPPLSRTIADVTAEIRFYKAQTVQSVIEIGRCLTEAKGLLEHGQWMTWLEQNVEISDRTARKYLQLAEQFSNRPPVANLTYTKLLALLAVPEEAREEFLEVPHNVGGEEKTVAFTVDSRQFAVVNEEGERVFEPGAFTVFAGGCQPEPYSEELSGSRAASVRVTMTGEEERDGE